MTHPLDNNGLFDHTEAEWQQMRRDPEALLPWLDQVVDTIDRTVITPLRQARLASMPTVATGASRLPIVDLVPPPSHPPLPRVAVPPPVAPVPPVASDAIPPSDDPPLPKGVVPPSNRPEPPSWFQVSESMGRSNRHAHHDGLLKRPAPSVTPSFSTPSDSNQPLVSAIADEHHGSKTAAISPSVPPNDPASVPMPPKGAVPPAPLNRRTPDTGLPLPSEIKSRAVDDQRRKRLEASIQDALKKNKGTIQ